MAPLVHKVDMSHSGCHIALDWFQFSDETRRLHLTDQVLRLFDYVEDNDLWLHKLPNSKEFTAGLQSLDLHFDDPLTIDGLTKLSVEKLIELGRPEIERINKCVEDAVKKAYFVFLPQWKNGPCLVYETLETRIWYISEIGNALALQSDTKVGLLVHRIEGDDKLLKISLRSIGTVDTTLFSKMHNGGGHVNSSGCTISVNEWEDIKNA